MKKLLAFSLLGSSLLAGVSPLKAEIFYGSELRSDSANRYVDIFSFDTSTNTKTKLGSYKYSEDSASTFIDNFAYGSTQYNDSEEKILIYGSTNANSSTTGKYIEFDLSTNTFSDVKEVSGENAAFYPIMTTGWASKNNVTSNSNKITTNTSNINNLGEGVAGSTALTAALSALPQTSKESKLSCGLGTGAYSSRYAVGFGCASKVNERIDINAGGSYVFGGSKSYGSGTLDSGVIKAGFAFKLGELNKSNQISMKEKKFLKQEINDLKENNKIIISQNKNLEIKNQSIIDQNKSLLARLERLEKVALGESKSKDLATIKIP